MPKKVKPSFPFGERLTALRKAKGFTQTQLAEKIGSTQRVLSRYETVAEYPPTPMLVELAKALGVSTDYLLGLQKPKASQPEQPVLSTEARRLWKLFQLLLSLPEKDRRAVSRLVHSLVSTRVTSRVA